MLPHDFDLQSSQIQTLSTRDAIVAFFATLGYDTDARLTQTPSAMGFPEALAHGITHIERIADHDAGALQVYLIEMKRVTVALMHRAHIREVVGESDRYCRQRPECQEASAA